MKNEVKPLPGEPADEISSDLDALRELDNAELRPGWLRQFALILVLVSAFVVIVWFSATRSESGKPVVFNEGVVVANDMTAGDWIGLALEQAMVATIRSGEQLRLINSIEPTTAYAAFGLSATSSAQSGAQWILRAVLAPGSPESDAVVVRLSLTRSGQASPTFGADVLGSANSISDLATRSTEQLLSWLELEGLSRQQLGYASSEVPSQLASELYGNGLADLSAVDGHAALAHFEAANDVAPGTAAIHEGMANAWEMLGYAENAARESLLALEASENLSRRRQLELEAQYARRSESWPRAQQVFSALKEFSPDNVSYRLAIADSQARQNDTDGFAESIRQIRAMDGVASDDPRIDLAEAAFWFRSGDYRQCFELSRVAETKATQSGDQYMLGEALLSAGRCDDTYDPDVLLRAREVFQALNTLVREPEILRELAKHEFAAGNMRLYLSYSKEALEQARRLGNEPEVAASQNALAIAYDLRGWLSRGYELKTRVAQYQRQRNNLNRYSIMLENIGISLFKLGRYDEAEATVDQAEKIFREIDDKIGIAWLPYRRGQITLRKGNIDAARTLMQQALENADERPEGGLAIEATYELGLIAFFSGDFEKATSLLTKANQYYTEEELSASVAESDIALARLASQTNDYAAVTRHLADAEQNLSNEVAYYSMSLKTELADFDLTTSAVDSQRRCDQLEKIVDRQEHREYLLRAKTRIVACRGLLGRQPYRVSNAMLVAVEEESRRLGLFDPIIAAGYVRAALLSESRRDQEAAAENARIRALATTRKWQAHPMPDLTLSRR